MPLLDQPVNVLMLGLAGSGKTSYMSSVYALCNDNEEQFFGFSIRIANYQLHTHLLRLASDIHIGKWPAGTDVMEEYRFNLMHEGDNVTDFIWADYRGGALTSDNKDEIDALSASMKTADAIMIFVDGAKLTSGSRHQFRSQVSRLTNLVNHSIAGRNDPVVVVLVLTKSDLGLGDDRERLEDLRPFIESINASQHIQGIFTWISCVTGGNLAIPILASAALTVNFYYNGAVKKLEELQSTIEELSEDIKRHIDNDGLGNRIGVFFFGGESEIEKAKRKYNGYQQLVTNAQGIINRYEPLTPSVEAIINYLKNAENEGQIFRF